MLGDRSAAGSLATGLRPDTAEQLIALEDIGVFAALAFADPERYLGKAISVYPGASRVGRTVSYTGVRRAPTRASGLRDHAASTTLMTIFPVVWPVSPSSWFWRVGCGNPGSGADRRFSFLAMRLACTG
jgi:hypothetical protein